MLKVECESCRAPYQIDERRVPATGLKMRCPKCGHSFMVSNPATAKGVAAAKPAAAPPVARPTRPEGVRVQKTMVGVAPPAAPPPPPPPPAASPKQPMPSDFPAALGSLDDADLPAVSPDLPARRAGPAAPARPAAPPAKPAAPTWAKPAAPAPPAFGEVDLPALPSDLPSAKSPAARPAAAQPAPSPARPAPRATFEADLPVVSPGDLPTAKRGARARDDADLPSLASDLPSAVHAGLPVVAAGLPSAVSAGLPARVAAGLPSPVASGLPARVAPGLPSLAGGDRGFGEIDLPSVSDVLPAVPEAGRHLPVAAQRKQDADGGDPFGDFGELDLPREGGDARAASAQQRAAPDLGEPSRGAGFGELDFDANLEQQRRTRSSQPPQYPSGSHRGTGSLPPPDVGGLGFGERDLAGGDASHSGEETEAPIPQDADVVPLGGMDAGLGGAGGFDGPVATTDMAAPRARPVLKAKRSSHGKKIALGVVALALIGGASLQLTPHGAFGYLTIMDLVNAKGYTTATTEAVASIDKKLASDTYDDARAALEEASQAHQRTPRARPLTAYAAFVEGRIAARFGPDSSRGPRAPQWLAEIPGGSEVKYLALANAAQAAAASDWAKARGALDGAGLDGNDPVALDAAVLRGVVELGAKDPTRALAAFTAASKLSQDARVQYGLAQAHLALGDRDAAKKDIEATLAASPSHVGAVLLRAMLAEDTDEVLALADVKTVIEQLAPKAAPKELAEALALRGWLNMGRGGTAEARTSFDEALKLNSASVSGLLGQGELLFREARYQEALTRFQTAMAADAASVDAVIGVGKTQIALDKLQDAKTLLVAANTRFPKNMQVLTWLGRLDKQLGAPADAEKELRAAVEAADPKKKDAVKPFLLLSSILADQGKASEAQAVLEDAKKRLPDSAALQRAFGEVAEQQGKLDEATTRYKNAIEKDPKDVSTRFRLGVTLRRNNKFDDASAEFDRVLAADKDYPGLALERGQLFEERAKAKPEERAKWMKEALDQFSAALTKTPEDTDLQLRVGAAYVALNDPAKAIVELKKVLKKRGTSADAQFWMGRALMLQGGLSTPEAYKDLKYAAELDPNRAEFHVYVAWVGTEMGPIEARTVKEHIEKAFALDKNLPEAYWLRGQYACAHGAIDDGMADLKKALQLRPSRYEAHAGLALCYNQKNERAAELAEWAAAVKGDDKRPDWRFHLGKSQYDAGNGDAFKNLVYASDVGDKLEPVPAWVGDAYYMRAVLERKAGKKEDALNHYKRYLNIAPVGAGDRKDAQQAVEELQHIR